MAAIGSFNPPASGTAVINTILTEEANRIGSDIYAQTLHTSPWIDLIRKSEFPSDMGYQLNTIVYDRSLPIRDAGADGTPDGTIGLGWTALGAPEGGSRNGFLASPARESVLGPQSGKSLVDFTRTLKSYSLSRAVIESPRINIEDLRFAAHRQEQLRAIMDLLKESTRFSWEERYRDEYDRVCKNAIKCLATGSLTLNTGLFDNVENKTTWVVQLGATAAAGDITNTKFGDLDVGDNDTIDTDLVNISNKVLDGVYFRLVRQGAGSKAYGRENGRPVFGLVLSSEASYALLTEAGFRDDVRYNNSKVSDLIAPLGVEKSFRGFYHLVDDMAPRMTFAGDYSASPAVAGGTFVRVPAYTLSSDIVIPNPAYDTADYEVAYVLHEEVQEALIPAPISGVQGMTFNPVNYRGDFKWTNIPDATYNPDGTIGFFRGIMASATKPIKTNFGYAIVFKRTSTTPAA
jgi:hypothetical protein